MFNAADLPLHLFDAHLQGHNLYPTYTGYKMRHGNEHS